MASEFIERTILSRPSAQGEELADITLRRDAEAFWVEEVVGNVDAAGRRTGVIYPRSARTIRAEADAAFRELIASRRREGFGERDRPSQEGSGDAT